MPLATRKAPIAPPAIALPPGTKRVTNRAGHYVVLNSFAAEKLRYWTVYRRADGTYRVKFNKSHDEDLARFGAFTIVHLHPQHGIDPDAACNPDLPY